MVRTSTIYKVHVLGAWTLSMIGVAAVVWVVWAALWVVAGLWADHRTFFTQDMLYVLCDEYDHAVRRGGNPSVQDLLEEIDEASIARCWRDAAGMYVDAWGNEVTVSEETAGGARAVIGRSRGPDSVAGTADDIVVRLPRGD